MYSGSQTALLSLILDPTTYQRHSSPLRFVTRLSPELTITPWDQLVISRLQLAIVCQACVLHLICTGVSLHSRMLQNNHLERLHSEVPWDLPNLLSLWVEAQSLVPRATASALPAPLSALGFAWSLRGLCSAWRGWEGPECFLGNKNIFNVYEICHH